MKLELAEGSLDAMESENEVETILTVIVVKTIPDGYAVSKPWAGLNETIVNVVSVSIPVKLICEVGIELSVVAL